MDYIVIALIIYGLIYQYIQDKKRLKDPYLKRINFDISNFFNDIEIYKNHYFTNKLKLHIKNKYEDTYNNLKKSYNTIKCDNEKIKFINIYSELDNLVDHWNKEYVSRELCKYNDLLSDIDGKSLDNQQRKAVVVDEDNCLVLAGAGSGKTLTITAKVKYLVEAKGINPNDILLISFTKKAAEEITERINNKLNISIQANTFHKLGLDIISKDREYRPDVSEELDSIVDAYFKNEVYKDIYTIQQVVRFFGYYINIPKDVEEFKNLGEYSNYIKGLDLTTLKGKSQINEYNKLNENDLKLGKRTIKGEQVKSLEEVIIANYLFLNGIEYIYEYKYPYETGDAYRKSYRPDFYLPEYDIYIEHFGINEDNKLPWLDRVEELKYLDGIKWKRALHKANGTKLIETYSYYNKNRTLEENLDKKLTEQGVCKKYVDYREVYKTIVTSKEDRYFKELRKLIVTFINLFKSNGYKEETFNNLFKEANEIENRFIKQRTLLFLDIVKQVYIVYENYLYENKELDFNDMINEATDIIKNGKVELNYKYIIIDEYQDISNSRFKLIKQIKERSNSKLMCVGDDWQSIYRFAGSDINLFTNFEKHVGYYELLKIENTYRNSQELIDIAGKFVMKNNNQLKKSLKSNKRNVKPIKIIKYSDDIYRAIDNAIEDIVYEFGPFSEISILGRNNFDINILSYEKSNGRYTINKKGNDVIIKCNKRKNLKINYLTAHKSKGLEAENVIIINLENSITGFPNQISDDPILDLVLTSPEKFEFAEERRLFYVALTRTKNRSYLVTPKNKTSIFVNELINEFNIEDNDISNTYESNKCPKCKIGLLETRQNDRKNISFVGCNNYPVCDFTSPYHEIINSTIICDKCNGYMIKRNGTRGKFIGCSNYPYCKNTKEIESNIIDRNKDQNGLGLYTKSINHVPELKSNITTKSIINNTKHIESQKSKKVDNSKWNNLYTKNVNGINDFELFIKYLGENQYSWSRSYKSRDKFKKDTIFESDEKYFYVEDIYTDKVFLREINYFGLSREDYLNDMKEYDDYVEYKNESVCEAGLIYEREEIYAILNESLYDKEDEEDRYIDIREEYLEDYDYSEYSSYEDIEKSYYEERSSFIQEELNCIFDQNYCNKKKSKNEHDNKTINRYINELELYIKYKDKNEYKWIMTYKTYDSLNKNQIFEYDNNKFIVADKDGDNIFLKELEVINRQVKNNNIEIKKINLNTNLNEFELYIKYKNTNTYKWITSYKTYDSLNKNQIFEYDNNKFLIADKDGDNVFLKEIERNNKIDFYNLIEEEEDISACYNYTDEFLEWADINDILKNNNF